MHHAIKAYWSMDINNSIITVLNLHTQASSGAIIRYLFVFTPSRVLDGRSHVRAQCWYLVRAACWTPFSSAASWDLQNNRESEWKISKQIETKFHSEIRGSSVFPKKVWRKVETGEKTCKRNVRTHLFPPEKSRFFHSLSVINVI